MGAWGAGVFENDDAGDFASAITMDKDGYRLESAFDKVLAVGDEYLEAPEASEALAAADIVARLRGNFGQRDAYTAAIDEWVRQVPIIPSDPLLAKAKKSVDRVMTEPSELLELWGEGDDLSEFESAVEQLSARLK